ncbi:MAG: nuclease, partial [Actinomycetota bacterium]|nr:nuclease [Actinomycetota bacterium]
AQDLEAPAHDADRGEDTAWLQPVDGACPSTHPVKAKVSSGIFHLPGMLAYDRTNADRCYRSEADAEADGFTKAKR